MDVYALFKKTGSKIDYRAKSLQKVRCAFKLWHIVLNETSDDPLQRVKSFQRYSGKINDFQSLLTKRGWKRLLFNFRNRNCCRKMSRGDSMKKFVLALGLLITLVMTLIPVSAQSATDSTFVAMIGRIDYYGAKPAYGCLGAFAEVKKWAEVKVIWTDMGPRILCFPAIYYFYAARLVKSNIVELKYYENDFYVSGLWDVWNITLYYDEHGNLWKKIINLIVDDGPGELNVFNGWKNFTVDIKPKPPMELIVGRVLRYWIRWFPIPLGDCNWDGKIDISDLVHVAMAYRSTPGTEKYDLSTEITVDIDLNFDYTVDIYDLTTIAANLGASY